jgi:sugar lactone lactonase YvrE
MVGPWGHGALFRLDPNARVSVHKTKMGISNTLAWSPDGLCLYFGDTLANTIWAYEYDPDTRDIGNERPFFQNFARGRPDSSTVDAEGYLWNQPLSRRLHCPRLAQRPD